MLLLTRVNSIKVIYYVYGAGRNSVSGQLQTVESYIVCLNWFVGKCLSMTGDDC